MHYFVFPFFLKLSVTFSSQNATLKRVAVNWQQEDLAVSTVKRASFRIEGKLEKLIEKYTKNFIFNLHYFRPDLLPQCDVFLRRGGFMFCTCQQSEHGEQKNTVSTFSTGCPVLPKLWA